MMNSGNLIYKYHFSKLTWLEGIVKPTLWRKKESVNSFSFCGEGNKCELLQHVFNINNLEGKYLEAVSGDGHEEKRITVLHSSSLAALLFFHGISHDNPMSMVLDGDKYTFTDVHFECKTVVCGSHKSNMDVVLVGHSEKYGKTVLFLECKFSEYLNTGKYVGICSNVYKDTYEKLGLFDGAITNMKAKCMDDEDTFELVQCAPYQYCAGIKQLISHYMGIRNLMKGGYKSEDEKDFSLDFTPNKVLLAEVLFRFTDKIDNKNRLKEYGKAYQELAVAINKLSENGVFHMVSECLTYDYLLKDSALPSRIKDFYQL